MLKKYIILLTVFSCFLFCFAKENKNIQQKSKMEELLKNDLLMEVETKFNGVLTEDDYEFLREYIPKCKDELKLKKIYYIIGKNMFLDNSRIKNQNNVEILALLCKKGGIALSSNYFDIFAKGEFPRKAEDIFINWFRLSPTKKLAFFLGKHYSSNKNGIDALSSKLHHSDKSIIHAIKLALIWRGDKKIIASEVPIMLKEIEAKLETTGNVTEPSYYVLLYYNDFLDGMYSKDITLKYLKIMIYSKYQGFNFGDSVSESPFHLAGFILESLNIKTYNFPYGMGREEAIKWWKENKIRIEKELPQALSSIAKRRSEKAYNYYKNNSFFNVSDLSYSRKHRCMLENLVLSDLRYILRSQKQLLDDMNTCSLSRHYEITNIGEFLKGVKGDDKLKETLVQLRNNDITKAEDAIENRIKNFKELLNKYDKLEKKFRYILKQLDDSLLKKNKQIIEEIENNISAKKKEIYRKKLSKIKAELKTLPHK